MGLFGKRKTILDIIREAEDDENQATGGETNETTAAETEAPEETPGEEGNEETAPSEDTGDGEDFNIDTELGDDTEGGEDVGDDIDTGSDSNDVSGGGETSGEGEPNKANTDIFASLTAEEQIVKIKELKNQFARMYASCDDLLAKVNDIDTNEFTLDPISRVSNTLYELKQYISDYMTNTFPHRSYIENDITFNRFLTILSAVTNVFEDINKENEKKGL